MLYNGLVGLGYKKHYCLDRGHDKFVRGHSHISNIESFLVICKNSLMKFKGMNKKTFFLQLKETEFHLNHCKESLSKLFLAHFKKYTTN